MIGADPCEQRFDVGVDSVIATDGDPSAPATAHFPRGLVDRPGHVVGGRSAVDASTGHVDGGARRAQFERDRASRPAARAGHQRNGVAELSHLMFYRGAAPLGLPHTLSRAPRRRRAPSLALQRSGGRPFAWLARALARSAISFLKTPSLVPILVQGPSGASEARRPSPLMSAPRTLAARRKGVPGSAARREGRFRRSRTFTQPTARVRGTPGTQRASDPLEGVLVRRTVLVELDPARCLRVPQPRAPDNLDIRGGFTTQTRHRLTVRVL